MKVKVVVCLLTLVATTATYADSPKSCPFTAKEVSAALGSDFAEGTVGFESDFGTGKSLSCRYTGKNFTLMVKQTVMKDPTQTKGWDTALAGKTEKIANDPDGALRQLDQGDLSSPNLHYVRKGTIVELRILGVGKQSPQFTDLSKKLPTLRKI